MKVEYQQKQHCQEDIACKMEIKQEFFLLDYAFHKGIEEGGLRFHAHKAPPKYL